MRRILCFSSIAGALMVVVSCQREVPVENNPNYNPETREVTTQFVMSVSTGGPRTKMSAETVQQATNFRGIEDAHLYTFITSDVPDGVAPYVNSTADPGEGKVKLFDLGTLYSNGDITAANNLGSSSRRVVQLSIPVNTDAALFYGKAINPSQGATNGYTKAVFPANNTPGDIEFQVAGILGDKSDAYDATARLMCFVINQIMGSSVDASGSYPALSWKDLGQRYEYNEGLYNNRFGLSGEKMALMPLEEILGSVYSTFTYIKNKEYRAGSSNAIKWMMQDMYAAVEPVSTATATSDKEANAKRLAEKIVDRMNNYFKSDWTYKDKDAIKAEVVSTQKIMEESAWNNATTGFADAEDLNKYPYGDFGIPEGAAQLAFDNSTCTFSYLHPNQPLVNPNVANFEPGKYVYPAELYYYVNSSLRTTSKDGIGTNDFPNGVNPWLDDTSSNNLWTAGEWASPGKVVSSTRGVAIHDNINYGVALLKTSVSFGTVVKLYDNRKNMTGEADQEISTSNANLSLRGILVGGVNPRYNWQFVGKYTTGKFAVFDGVIYDDQLVSTAVPTPTNAENYTLVYDNYNQMIADSQSQSDVYIALEFENKGNAFWGRDNVIRNGAVFYLVAKLPCNPSGQTITWPTTYQIPPLYGVNGETVPEGKTAGQSKQIPRIFIQDFMTTAVFCFDANSLQRAYYSLPDLRSSQMSLGLSVDLSWQSGYNYNVTFE